MTNEWHNLLPWSLAGIGAGYIFMDILRWIINRSKKRNNDTPIDIGYMRVSMDLLPDSKIEIHTYGAAGGGGSESIEKNPESKL